MQPFAEATHLLAWIERVRDALAHTNARYPFLAYGTDWTLDPNGNPINTEKFSPGANHWWNGT